MTTETLEPPTDVLPIDPIAAAFAERELEPKRGPRSSSSSTGAVSSTASGRP